MENMHKSKPTLTLDLNDDEKFRLRLLAEQFGLVIGRGSMADTGSIQKLISGIANGKFKLIDATEETITFTTSNSSNKNIAFMPESTAGEYLE